MSPAHSHGRQPHPMEPQIRALLSRGLNDAQISDRLNAPPRVVARVRKDTGTGPAPRSSWRRKPHPKARKIRKMLAGGYNNSQIHARTGAGVKTIARMRADGAYGKPTVARTPRPHPRDAEIRALLPHHSSNAIAEQLGVDRAAVRRIRAEAGVPYTGGFASAEEKWRAHVRPVDGGHLEWTGERAASPSRTPVMRYREESYSPAAVAFEIRHGRKPEGYVRADCGFRQCVAPDHVDDTTTRQRTRELLRYLTGGPARQETCRQGHDQAEYGRLESDGAAYCEACKRIKRAEARSRAKGATA